VRAAAPRHPEGSKNPAFKALVAKDKTALSAMGEKPVLQLLAQANSGMTTAVYDQTIRAWLESARDPKFHRPVQDRQARQAHELGRRLPHPAACGSRNDGDMGRAVHEAARAEDVQPAHRPV
jgi:hypothetical protein